MNKRYIVTMNEVHMQQIAVSGTDEEDAMIKAVEGDGDYIDGSEYLYTMDRETFTVKEDSK